MKLFRKAALVTAAVMTALLLSAGAANAQEARIGWGFLFPIPIPLPIYQIPHEPSPVTIGLLFPIPIPLPVFDYPYYYTTTAPAPAARPAVRQRPMRYGQLMLKVRPESASVFVNGKYYGRAGDFATRDSSATVYPGQAKIEIKAQGYRNYVVYGDINPGELVTIQYDLQPETQAPPK